MGISTIVMAVLGGFILGAGVGWLIAKATSGSDSHELTRMAAQYRQSVIPILERQADAIGLPKAHRSWDTTDDFKLTLGLAEAIRDHETTKHLPYSDTLEAGSEVLASTEGST